MALSKFSEDYDLFFRNAPLRDLKQVHAHFLPSGLEFIIAKQAVLLGVFNGPKLLARARDDPSIVAKILAKHVALDLAYTSVRRALERTALALLEKELAARFFRGKSAPCFLVQCMSPLSVTPALFRSGARCNRGTGSRTAQERLRGRQRHHACIRALTATLPACCSYLWRRALPR